MNKIDNFDSAVKFISSIYSHKYHNQPSTAKLIYLMKRLSNESQLHTNLFFLHILRRNNNKNINNNNHNAALREEKKFELTN